MTEPQDNQQSTNGRFLNEIESKRLILRAGLKVTEPVLVSSVSEAVNAARRMGYPVALKIASADIIHKSDAGGVVINLTNPESVEDAFIRITTSVRQHYPEAQIDGITVQPQASPGVELIIGMKRDPQFGPVIMFGLGGVWVEIFNDVSLRIAPLSREDASEMISSLKGYRLLDGYRGQPKVDTATLEDWLIRVSDLAMKNPQIKEMDINPIIAYERGAVAVDARVLLDEEYDSKSI